MKMNELVKKSDTPKSTILYYIKEGLLPEPEKPKPNQHLYDARCVERIGFIKYLQKHFSCSIDELKALMGREQFDIGHGFETLLETLDMIMGAAHQELYAPQQLCDHFGITEAALRGYVERGLLFPREGHYTRKEFEILEILEEGRREGIDALILESYVTHARALAKLEVELGSRLFGGSEKRNGTLKALFDTTLILKPYLFNMHTLETYRSHKEHS